ncbi:MAG: D-alanine--D-alanine ligase [Ignavibacteria bacterium]|nr:D-alanine--D-alanine ligase [Ignavibacteria bacterium]
MKVVVFFGGISNERDISIKSGLAVATALAELGHYVLLVDPALGSKGFYDSIHEASTKVPSLSQLDRKIYTPKMYIEAIHNDRLDDFEIAFPVLHGKFGEDGLIQSLLELRGLPYTGSGVKASALGIDKNTSKILFSSVGITTPRWSVFKKNDIGNFEIYEDIRNEFNGKIVVKPNDEGSTIGVSIIEGGNLDDINKAFEIAGEYSDTIIVEEYIEGQEITVGILGDEPLPVIEIIPKSGFYDFEHKYEKGKTEFVCPAELPEDVSAFTQTLALNAFNILGCKGFARADFRLSEDYQPFLLEINTIPGFTEHSLVPKAAKSIGIEFPELCQRIIDLALNKE